jgi:type III restriction enzyme
LQPDFTILATATPNDDKLQVFEEKAGIEVASRIIIDRGQVVDAGLNKRGLMLGILRFLEENAAIIDLEQATLTGAWLQHQAVKERLAERQLAVT